jgi:hypothetical protein
MVVDTACAHSLISRDCYDLRCADFDQPKTLTGAPMPPMMVFCAFVFWFPSLLPALERLVGHIKKAVRAYLSFAQEHSWAATIPALSAALFLALEFLGLDYFYAATAAVPLGIFVYDRLRMFPIICYIMQTYYNSTLGARKIGFWAKDMCLVADQAAFYLPLQTYAAGILACALFSCFHGINNELLRWSYMYLCAPFVIALALPIIFISIMAGGAVIWIAWNSFIALGIIFAKLKYFCRRVNAGGLR